MLLTFDIKKQLIRRTDREIPVAKSENYLFAQFSFSEEWTGIKTAIFNNGTAYSTRLGSDNKCLIPWEVITDSGFSVSVFCGERITANVAFVDVLPSGYIEGQTPAPPSPTVYDQLSDAITKNAEDIASLEEEKLSASNIKGGDNVTVEIDGDDVIINSEGGGASDYTDLDNKPAINSVELIGNKSLSDLGIQPAGDYATNAALSNEAEARAAEDNKKVNIAQGSQNVGKALIVGNDGNVAPVAIPSADLPWTELSEDVNINDLADGAYVATDEITFTYGSGIYDVMGLNAGDIISIAGAQAVILSSYGFITLQESSGVWYANAAAMQNEVDTALSGKVDTSAVKQAEGQSTTDIMSQKATTDALSGKLSNPLIFSNITVSSWDSNADTGYEAYSYKKTITCSGVTSSMLATLILPQELATSGNYACDTGADTVTIYAKVNTAITINSIIAGAPISIALGDDAINDALADIVGGI